MILKIQGCLVFRADLLLKTNIFNLFNQPIKGGHLSVKVPVTVCSSVARINVDLLEPRPENCAWKEALRPAAAAVDWHVFRHRRSDARRVTKTGPELLSGWISRCAHVEKSSPWWIAGFLFSSQASVFHPQDKTLPSPPITPPSALSFSLSLTSTSPCGFPSSVSLPPLPLSLSPSAHYIFFKCQCITNWFITLFCLHDVFAWIQTAAMSLFGADRGDICIYEPIKQLSSSWLHEDEHCTRRVPGSNSVISPQCLKIARTRVHCFSATMMMMMTDRPHMQIPLCVVFSMVSPLPLVLISYKRLTLSKLTISMEQKPKRSLVCFHRAWVDWSIHASFCFCLLVLNRTVEEELLHLFFASHRRAAATIVFHAQHWLIVKLRPERPNWDP